MKVHAKSTMQTGILLLTSTIFLVLFYLVPGASLLRSFLEYVGITNDSSKSLIYILANILCWLIIWQTSKLFAPLISAKEDHWLPKLVIRSAGSSGSASLDLFFLAVCAILLAISIPLIPGQEIDNIVVVAIVIAVCLIQNLRASKTDREKSWQEQEDAARKREEYIRRLREERKNYQEQLERLEEQEKEQKASQDEQKDNAAEETVPDFTHPDQDIHLKEFSWEYEAPLLETKGQDQITVPINLETYRSFQDFNYKNPVSGLSDYRDRVIANPDDEIEFIADEFNYRCSKNNLCSYEKINYAVSFIKFIEYKYDHETPPFKQEYARFPVETLEDACGDCECHAILAAAILRAMKIDVMLLYVKQPDPTSPVDHMAVAIAGADSYSNEGFKFYVDQNSGKKYYYFETTGKDSCYFGEVPPGWDVNNVEGIPV